ncbi:MAG: YaiI/YqxD family protein [Bdellovibrionales bacterium]
MLKIYIDADACAVKDETYKVAKRYELITYVIANQYLKVPLDINIRMEVVSEGFDAADDWIVEKARKDDIVITSDLLLAERCVENGCRVLGQKGNELTPENIGSAISGREIATHLRDLGASGTGPSAMSKFDRSKFLSKLDQVIQAIKKDNK